MFRSCFGGQRIAPLIQRTSESLIIKGFGGQRVAILIQRTNESLFVEEFRGSTGIDFDTAQERRA